MDHLKEANFFQNEAREGIEQSQKRMRGGDWHDRCVRLAIYYEQRATNHLLRVLLEKLEK